MFNSNFSNLSGILCAGFYIHQFVVPIMHKAKEPEKNTRNLFIGYCLVLLTYILVGIFGYFAFAGSSFKEVYAN